METPWEYNAQRITTPSWKQSYKHKPTECFSKLISKVFSSWIPQPDTQCGYAEHYVYQLVSGIPDKARIILSKFSGSLLTYFLFYHHFSLTQMVTSPKNTMTCKKLLTHLLNRVNFTV